MIAAKQILQTILCAISVSLSFAQTDTLPSYAQYDSRPSNAFRIAFWNQENLFDTYNDSLTNDEAFLPDGQNAWTESRYYTKLMNMSKSIVAVGGWEPVDLFGFCEVENKMVVRELVERTALRLAGYDVVHFDSPDSRGIDVALIYRKAKFNLVTARKIPVVFAEEGSRATRDILYVKGLVMNRDTLHFFVNHWPSRMGGALATAPKRNFAAKLVRTIVDSIFSVVPNANIVITGDFNDHPEDESMHVVLDATHDRDNLKENQLFNLMYEKTGKEGSHKFQGHWGILDQMVVTSGMLNNKSTLKVNEGIAHIFKASWLLMEDTQYTGHTLFRTYSGPRYLGGYSDHLPVWLDLVPALTEP